MVLRWMDALQVVLVRLSNWFQIKVLGFPIKTSVYNGIIPLKPPFKRYCPAKTLFTCDFLAKAFIQKSMFPLKPQFETSLKPV